MNKNELKSKHNFKIHTDTCKTGESNQAVQNRINRYEQKLPTMMN